MTLCNIIWRPLRNTQFSKVTRFWHKNWASHAPQNFGNMSIFKRFLTLSYPRGGPYHESIRCCQKVRATVAKAPEFVSFDSCQVPESQFWCLFFKKLKKMDVENFWGSLSIRWKSEFFKFFTNKPYFFKLNLNCSCSQLSIEVHYTFETKNFELFFYDIHQTLLPSSD